MNQDEWKIEEDEDESGCEYWKITDGDKYFRCYFHQDAEWLLGILNSVRNLVAQHGE